MEPIDLSDDLSFRAGFPHEYFTWLRKNSPIYWHEPTNVTPDKEGFWVVCCYEDVNYVLRNPRIFSSDKAGERIGGGTGIKDEKTAGKLLNQSDGAQHRRLRALVQKGFTLKAVQELENVLRKKAKSIFCELKVGDKLDFAASISPEIPTQAICMVLGVPEKDRKDLCEWIDLGIEATSTSVIASEYLAKIRHYSKSLIETKRDRPTLDIFSRIVHAEFEEDGSKLTDYELGSFFSLLFPAGAETTTRSITGAIQAFIDNPRELEKLRANKTLVKSAIEEVVRWTTPSVYKRRTAKSETVIQDCRIAIGDKVTVWEMSANRDEQVFEDPFLFNIEREPNKHLGFGAGAHFCLGASLARLELKIVLEEFLASDVLLSIDGPIEWTPNNRLVGIKRLPVKVVSRTV
jgi:cytochrome P450